MVEALNQAAALAPAAQSEVEQQFALTAATRLLAIAGGEQAEAISKLYGLVSNPGGTAVSGLTSVPETVTFFSEMYRYFQVSQGNLDALEASHSVILDASLASQIVKLLDRRQIVLKTGLQSQIASRARNPNRFSNGVRRTIDGYKNNDRY